MSQIIAPTLAAARELAVEFAAREGKPCPLAKSPCGGWIVGATPAKPEPKAIATERRPNLDGAKGWASEANGICNRCHGTGVWSYARANGGCLRCKGTGRAPGFTESMVRRDGSGHVAGLIAEAPAEDFVLVEEVAHDDFHGFEFGQVVVRGGSGERCTGIVCQGWEA